MEDYNPILISYLLESISLMEGGERRAGATVRTPEVFESIGSLGNSWGDRRLVICEYFTNSFTGFLYNFLSEALYNKFYSYIML